MAGSIGDLPGLTAIDVRDEDGLIHRECNLATVGRKATGRDVREVVCGPRRIQLAHTGSIGVDHV